MNNRPSVFDCSVIDLGKINFDEGNLTVVENNSAFPFDVKRVFYLYDIAGGENRGAHSHKECHQFLIAASGSFEVALDDGQFKRQVFLNSPNLGLHIPPGIWASEINFSSGAICLVLASQRYDERDYIRDYDDFKKTNVTKKLRLAEYTSETLAKSWIWLNDPEIKELTQTPDFTKEQQQKWFNDLKKSESYFVKSLELSGEIIGVAGLKHIDKNSENAEYFGYIGEKQFWGNGLSKQILKLIISEAKARFHLKSVYLNVSVNNIRAVRAYENFGFRISNIEAENVLMNYNI